MGIYEIRSRSTRKACISDPNVYVHNVAVLTEQLGLSRFALKMADSPVGAFQIIFDNHMIKCIQQCTNVEARKVLGNEE